MNLKKLERYLRVNLLGTGPRLIKKNLPGRGLTKVEKLCPTGWRIRGFSVARFVNFEAQQPNATSGCTESYWYAACHLSPEVKKSLADTCNFPQILEREGEAPPAWLRSHFIWRLLQTARQIACSQNYVFNPP